MISHVHIIYSTVLYTCVILYNIMLISMHMFNICMDTRSIFQQRFPWEFTHPGGAWFDGALEYYVCPIQSACSTRAGLNIRLNH